MSDYSKPLIAHTNGYQLPQTEIWIDPTHPVHTAVVSHAHGDHAVPGHGKVYCTKNTARLLRTRYRNFADTVITPDYHEWFEVDGVSFQFIPAGHMLGSAQIVWKHEGRIINYTGDYKRQSDASCEQYETVKCDVLITETTFAQQGKTHPADEDSLKAFDAALNTNYIVGAYALGKAQRLTRLFADLKPAFKIMVHPKISKYHRVYEEAGFDLGEWLPYQKQVFKTTANNIYIVPPLVLQSYASDIGYLRGMASGWDRLQEGYDIKLPVSDHSDWHDLLNTITESEAKVVYTIHGDSNELMQHLSNAAVHIEEL
jgi:putative mRNA 3-end processing factor